MSPTWYDVLGVAPGAGPTEIKAAWRDATDKFEPGAGSGQFRMFNEAADVLLDPQRRQQYDAGLAAGPSESGPSESGPSESGPSESGPSESGPSAVSEPDAGPALITGLSTSDTEEPRSPRASRLMTLLALVVLPVLVIASLGLAGVGLYQHHRDGQVAVARTEAPAAADRALSTMLGYDYQKMTAGRDATITYLTPAYRKKYLASYALLTKGKDGAPGPAITTKAVVTANVLDTSVVDASPDRVRVLVFVNQTSKKGTAAPVIFEDRVVADMVRSGGQWLIDDVSSY